LNFSYFFYLTKTL